MVASDPSYSLIFEHCTLLVDGSRLQISFTCASGRVPSFNIWFDRGRMDLPLKTAVVRLYDLLWIASTTYLTMLGVYIRNIKYHLPTRHLQFIDYRLWTMDYGRNTSAP